jgi:hypothetical protein
MVRERRRKRGKDVKRAVPRKKGIESVRSGRYGFAFAFFFITIAILLALAAYNRNHMWKEGETIWEDVIGKSPWKAKARYNLGDERMKPWRSSRWP